MDMLFFFEWGFSDWSLNVSCIFLLLSNNDSLQQNENYFILKTVV